mmetsp:Transcript_2163/g.3026  ORF Transcript_2163/g.3026 Transcript_2163/m.3026 type:complete len:215 (-) Transcript_2163:398-1042(-)
MVSSNWEWGVILKATNYIEVWHTWFNHEHVSTLLCVKSSLDECFATVGGVLLVGFLIAESWMTIQSITEWTIVSRSVFSSVGENRNVSETLRVKSITNCLHTPIHHITGGNNISSGTSLGDSLLTELVDGSIIDNFSTFYNTIVTLVRVRIKGNIGTDDTIGVLFLNHADGTVNNTFRVVCFDSKVSLKFIRNLGEKDKGLNTKFKGFSDFLEH